MTEDEGYEQRNHAERFEMALDKARAFCHECIDKLMESVAVFRLVGDQKNIDKTTELILSWAVDCEYPQERIDAFLEREIMARLNDKLNPPDGVFNGKEPAC